MKETFTNLWNGVIDAFTKSYGRNPTQEELVAIRKFVIIETAVIMAVKESK